MLKSKRVIDWPFIVVVFLGILLAVFSFYRAATLSITHDEAIIGIKVIPHTYQELFNFVIPQDHMLNSMMMKWFNNTLPPGEFALRAPNLLGHLLYIIFSILLLRRLKNPHLLLAGFIFLNFNPYLLDFFSLARGYGLSTSLMMVSIYFAYAFYQEKKTLPLFFALFFGALSVLTVYTLLNYFMALLGLVFIIILLEWISLHFKINRKFILLASLAVVMSFFTAWVLYLKLHEPLQRLQDNYLLYQPFDSNFYRATIRSVVAQSIYQTDAGPIVDVIGYTVIIAYVATFTILLCSVIRKDFVFTSRIGFFSIILTLIVVFSIILQYKLFNVRILGFRTATFIIPLFALGLIGLFQESIHIKLLRKPAIVLLYFLAALFMFNMIKNLNVTHYLEWKYDASTKEMMKELKEETVMEPGNQIKLGINWLFEPSVNYYRLQMGMEWLEPVTRDGFLDEYDSYYIFDEDSVLPGFDMGDKTVLGKYPLTRTMLLKQHSFDPGNFDD
jgi:hypothetical protein